jgi:putative ABC transport system ATP-binding protein
VADSVAKDAGAGAGTGGGTPILELSRVSKVYGEGRATRVEALRDVSLSIRRGESMAVLGPSGSGKSTLLHILGCLDRPTAGVVRLEGLATAGLRDAELAAVRNRKIGFVFQAFHLLPNETALENVALPLLYRGMGAFRARARAAEALSAVGLTHRARHRPGELSGGEQARVAIARALGKEPEILLADEPTGNLDSRSGAAILDLLVEANRRGVTLVIITHDPAVAGRTGRHAHLLDGGLVEERR